MLKSLLQQYMPRSIVFHFNQQTPEKTVNIICLVILDIECIENKIVKELEVYMDGKTEGYSFPFPKNNKTTPKSTWCRKHNPGYP